MPDKSDNPFKFWEELKRRKVVRVITVYAAASFVLLELVDIITEPFGLPDWTLRFVFVLLSIGFLIAVILSWVYDITPEGVQKTKRLTQNSNEARLPPSKGWKISTYSSILVIIVFVVFYVIGNIKQSSDISNLEKSIAVLPFENWSIGGENSHLGDGIANEIATQLANVQEFNVRSYTSSSQYKGTEKPSMPQIGRELDANFIIEGSVERLDEDVSIHVQVIQAENDNHIWAHEFKDSWKDIIKLRSQIALGIAEELKTMLSPEEIEQIERKPTENVEAYNFYLRGNDFYWRSYQEENWSIAINMYQKAIKLDSSFALAYTMLARSYLSLYWWHHDRSIERLNEAKKAIDTAFDIDPDLAEAYIALGCYYYWGLLDYAEALKHFETTLGYLPNNAECQYLIACVYRRMGDWQKALEEFKKSYKNDPTSPRINQNIGETYYLLGDYPNAFFHINKAINISPEFLDLYITKINIFLKWEGNTKNARKTFEEASLFINPSTDPKLIEVAVLLYIYDGKYQDAIDFLNTTNFEAIQNQFRYYPKALLYATIYELMEDTEQAEHYFNLSRIVLEDKILDYPEDSRLYSSLGISYAGLGQKERAIQGGIKGVELLPISKEAWKGTRRLGDLARIYVTVGEYELALEQLDYLLSIPGFLSAKLLQLDPIWKPLWDLPEFTQLIEKYSDN